MDDVTPQVFDLYFTGDGDSKRPSGLDRVRASLERLLEDVRTDMVIRRDKCYEKVTIPNLTFKVL